MTKTSMFVSTLLALVLLTAGCAKTTDLGKMQEETIASVKVYLNELDVLQRRHDNLVRAKGPSVPKNATDKLDAAGEMINRGRTLAASAPTMVATAAKSGNADQLTRVNDETIEQLSHEIALAKDNLDAYEQATANPPATAPAAAPTPTPAPASPDTPVSNDAGSAAAKMPAGTTPPNHTSDIPCEAEIVLNCPEGQIDACMKQPPAGKTHACVAK